MLDKMDVRQLWANVRSLTPALPYCVVPHDNASEAGLLTFRSQPSASHSTLPPREDLRSKSRKLQVNGDITLLEEDLDGNDRERSVDCTEDSSLPKSRPGWIDGVYFCAKASALLLLLNLILIATAAGLSSKYPHAESPSTSKVIYEGSCIVSNRWNTALHLIVNILSTCILAASNYCMQTLVAPTRDEIDAFHEKRRWLDIGSASIRNLFAIPRDRLGLWVILFLTATPFHLLYEFTARAPKINQT